MSCCSSPTSVAEKALKVIGLGTFVPNDAERYLGQPSLKTIGMFSDYEDIFDNALIRNDEAQYVIKNKSYKKTETSDFFDFSNVLFDKYQLITKTEITYDLYYLVDYLQFGDQLPEDIIRQMKEANKQHPEYKEINNYATWLIAKDAPAYSLRYKLDNRYIANVTVVKIPDEGYRVCAFWIE